MTEEQAYLPNLRRTLNTECMIFAFVIGLIAFAIAWLFLIQQPVPVEKFLRGALVVCFVGLPVFLTPLVLTTRNDVLGLMSRDALVEIVLSTRAMKRFGLAIIGLSTLLVLYMAFLEALLVGFWAGLFRITLKCFLVWAFGLIQVLEVVDWERRQRQEGKLTTALVSIPRFALRIFPLFAFYLFSWISLFGGIFLTAYLGPALYSLVGLVIAVLLFFAARLIVDSVAKRLGV